MQYNRYTSIIQSMNQRIQMEEGEFVANKVPKYMVTTSDNPFDYFTQFDEWNAFDTQHGYNTLAYLARVCVTNPDSTEIEKTMDINDAVEDILRLNLTGNYIRIEEPENKIKNDGDISE